MIFCEIMMQSFVRRCFSNLLLGGKTVFWEKIITFALVLCIIIANILDVSMKKCAFISFLSLLFVSCINKYKEPDKIFNFVENIVEQYPDNALVLLDSIQNSFTLDEGRHAKYTLLLVQAKDKAGQDISGDSLIFSSRDYFKKQYEPENLALAEFYCGKVYQSQGKSEEATQAYLDAETTSEKIRNDHLKGLIQFYLGNNYYDKLLYNEAIPRYKSAANYFSCQDGKYANYIISLNAIGNCFLLKQEKDSAFYYYNQGLILAKSKNDSIEEVIITKNIGIALLEVGDTRHAKKQFFHAIELTRDSSMQSDIYLNLAKVYVKENKPDSALFFTTRALAQFEKKNDTEKLAIAYRLLSKIEEKSGNFQASLEYQKQYTRHLSLILAEKENFAILDIQKKYNFKLIQNENYELMLEKRKTQVITLCIIIGLLIALYTLYWKIKKNKNDLFEARQKIYRFKETEENLKNTVEQRSEEFIDMLSQQFNLQLKATLLENYLPEQEKISGKNLLKKFNEIVYGKDKNLDWSLLLQSMNKLYDHFPDKLRKSSLKLSDEEIYICCLSKAGLRNDEIAVFFEPSTTANAIQLKKSTIRQKTGMKERENFVKQLDTIV
jgi:tetratricopeptide (TPR) repeat protein